MKFGVFSDLHLEFHSYKFPTDMNDEVDAWLNAGDTHPFYGQRVKFERDNLTKPHVTIMGNHDVYRDDWYGTVPTQHVEIGGVKVSACTLWTDGGNEYEWRQDIRNYLNDSRMIASYDYDTYTETHQDHVQFLRDNPADIVMTHHLPSYLSVHPKYAVQPNRAFASNLDQLVEDLQPKYWIHGHTHEKFDYMIGKTRVICHPRGYIHESNFNDYRPTIIEV